ncbi:50S ribosomal protein L3 [Candidatus Micrarchaeota archaeon]|nr:50S ribosomal protein L3 [Candidatus Micrarchaeota archaeon]MBU1165959.1 50S ribosomal protein L3 [Candidatus Micrarchaeota archaeon]MBU1886863.1 50S ribosomal protein L3 [Candidatus Micrarchaeota archaeon]
MTDIRKPRKGSMAHRPRKRARSQNPNVHWQSSVEQRVLGFAGYKVGMTHIAYVDDTESPTKGQEIVSAATIIEVPPLVVYGIRCYDSQNSIGDIISTDEKLLKLAGFKKIVAKEIKEDRVENVRLLVFAMPSKTKMGKKHIEKMEIGCGGKSGKEKLDYCKSILGKELKASDVFKIGEHVDVISITKGKGWQGPVKRFGVSIQRRKATGKRRHVGTLGQWHPAYVLYTAPQAGQTGYHRRTEMNKRIMKISQNPEEVNPNCGFPSYGFVSGDFMIVKGSIPGPVKRLMKLRLALRHSGAPKEPQVSFVSK